MKRISILGIWIGGMVDIAASNIVSIPLLVIAMFRLGRQPGVSRDAIKAQLLSTLHSDPKLHLIGIALGLCCTILGGYVAARIAKKNELLNGTLASLLGLIVGFFSSSAAVPLREKIALQILAVLCAFFGGWLRLTQKRRGERRFAEHVATQTRFDSL